MSDSTSSGSWLKIPLIEKGGVSLVDTKKANQLIRMLNSLGALKISPSSNICTWRVNEADMGLDFARLDSRLQSIEPVLGINSSTNTTSITIVQQVSDLTDYVNVVNAQVNVAMAQTNYVNTRLNSCTATANCVGNTVHITFNFPS